MATRSALLWLVTSIAVLASSGTAGAQPWTGERWVRGRAHRVGGSAAFFGREGGNLIDPGNGEQWAFSPSFEGRFRLVDENAFHRDAFILDLDVAWRSVGAWGDADSFRVGNPYVGLRLGWRAPRWRLRFGAGTTAPLSNAFEDGGADRRAWQLGQALHGAWDPWLLEPEVQPLVLRGDFELHGRYFQVGFDASLGVVFPLRRAGGGDTEYVFQTGAFGAATPIPELALGGRFQLVFASDWRVGFGGDDEAQLALIPFVRVQLEPAFFELALVMNLDDPYGFAFDDGVYAVLLKAGGRF
ncbi:MAG TPA: hypothetical protein RMH99_22915 [Sandaracinaceae bacterium LLY-WYZ-13_1]|nr:hypothetical protein [Sandaracinaceae bacterium LLY-WYZ-13_1]